MNENYNPSTPLKADATDEQMIRRFWALGNTVSPETNIPVLGVLLAREFAASCVAELKVELDGVTDGGVAYMREVLVLRAENEKLRAALGRSPSPAPDVVREALTKLAKDALDFDLLANGDLGSALRVAVIEWRDREYPAGRSPSDPPTPETSKADARKMFNLLDEGRDIVNALMSKFPPGSPESQACSAFFAHATDFMIELSAPAVSPSLPPSSEPKP